MKKSARIVCSLLLAMLLTLNTFSVTAFAQDGGSDNKQQSVTSEAQTTEEPGTTEQTAPAAALSGADGETQTVPEPAATAAAPTRVPRDKEQDEVGAGGIKYIDTDGSEKTVDSYTEIDSGTIVWNSGWYAVTQDVWIENDRVQTNGSVNLILCDNAKLTVEKGITVNSGNSFTVWGQKNGTGKLYAGTPDGINHSCEDCCAGIGGGVGDGGTISISGGEITANGGDKGAGIGGGNRNGGIITIKGGKINANGGMCGAGIGGGDGNGGNITINGGTVTGNGGFKGAGIGGGGVDGNLGDFGYSGDIDITINGGTVTGNGGYGGAGIGGGSYSGDSDITINGGTVTGNGGYKGAGIGGGDGNGGTISISGGEITANGGDKGAGIGSGYDSNGCNVIFNGGKITARDGGDNSQPIGHGVVDDNSISSGSLTFGRPSMRVGTVEMIYGKETVTYVTSDKREETCRNGSGKAVRIEVCYPHTLENDSCKYCASSGKLSGAGTENDPYLIKNAGDWYTLIDYTKDGKSNKDDYFRQTADITVYAMTDTFRGHYDGGGHTLTFNAASADAACAPFVTADCAEFSNLRTAGTITANHKFASGLIGTGCNDIKIINCRSSVKIDSNVNGDGTHGGFIAVTADQSSTEIEGCVFDGELAGDTTTLCGGFVGYARSYVTIKNCLFAPAACSVTKGQTFTRYRYADRIKLENACYMTAMDGSNQGKQCFSVTIDPSIDSDLGESTDNYSASRLDIYQPGMMFDDHFYACKDDTVLMMLSIKDIPAISDVDFTATRGTSAGSRCLSAAALWQFWLS